MLDIQMPPSAYVQEEPKGVFELQLPIRIVNNACRALGVNEWPGRFVYGCALPGLGRCLIIVPQVNDIFSWDDQAQVRRHEHAHYNGWRH